MYNQPLCLYNFSKKRPATQCVFEEYEKDFAIWVKDKVPTVC